MTLTVSLRLLKRTLLQRLNPSDGRARIQDADFIAGLLYAVTRAGKFFSLNSLRLQLCDFVGVTIGRSAFNERLGTASLTKQLEIALESLLSSARKTCASTNAKSLARKLGVEGIVAVDASLVSLWDSLAKHFKGTFVHAALKLHFGIDVITGLPVFQESSAGATHDSQHFPQIRPQQLYLFDLGYWSIQRLVDINQAKAFFVSRLKNGSKFVISESGKKNLIGQRVSEIKSFQGKTLELYGNFSADASGLKLRILGSWNKKTKSYHWYISNHTAAPKVIFAAYRLRWQIELAFKAMKSTFNFDRMPTSNPNAVRSFYLIAIANYVLSVILRAEEQENQDTATGLSLLRAAQLLKSGCSQLYQLLKLTFRATTARIEKMTEPILALINSFRDPNYKTRLNTERKVAVCFD